MKIDNKLKLKFVLIILIFVLSIGASFAEVNPEGAIEDTLKQYEYLDKVDAHFDGNDLTLKLDLNYFDKETLYNMVDLIDTVYSMMLIDNLTLKLYDNYLPYMDIVISASDIKDYEDSKIDDNEFIETFIIKDTRSTEKKLYDDLSVFDSYIDGIFVDKNEVKLNVEYVGKYEEIMNEYYAMTLISLEDAPWISNVTINYVDGSGNLLMRISTRSKDIVDVINGDISKKDFLNNLDMATGSKLEDLVKENADLIKNMSISSSNASSVESDSSSSDKSDSVIETDTKPEASTNTKNSNDNNTSKVNTNDTNFKKYNVADAKIVDTLISGGVSNIYELQVDQDGEYDFNVNNAEKVPLSFVIADKDLLTVKDNKFESGYSDYVYVDLKANQTYYLLVMPKNNEDYGKEFNLSINKSASIMGFLIGFLLVIALIIFGIVMLVKKIRKK
ncbi:hypothetical protein [Helicovermis profundi]|uniref:Uncharacterized protein n=1 Tax=Helicovermis profundi TaxID=3065157 RepID=A0AAU9EBU7_9FIRM|nr:hypothetical protein HLPR_26380 [Clostridia bacterium S502]